MSGRPTPATTQLQRAEAKGGHLQSGSSKSSFGEVWYIWLLNLAPMTCACAKRQLWPRSALLQQCVDLRQFVLTQTPGGGFDIVQHVFQAVEPEITEQTCGCASSQACASSFKPRPRAAAHADRASTALMGSSHIMLHACSISCAT